MVVAAGTFRSRADDARHFAHRWSSGGVSVEAAFTGAHLLHLATAGCVLNDVYREAGPLGVVVDGVRVTAYGGFDDDAWRSTGITYVVELDSTATAAAQAALLDTVDAVAEIPRAVRAGAPVAPARDARRWTISPRCGPRVTGWSPRSAEPTSTRRFRA